MPLRRQSAARTQEAERTKREKTAVIYSDQQTGLDGLARELQDARSVLSERITANTLIRVAIDGVLEYADRLHGDDEEELRASWLAFLSGQAAGALPDGSEDDEDSASGNSRQQ
jgi:hypothetical protein